MTFRILNSEARDQIAAHIFGSPPQTHPRAGSVSGTDVAQFPIGDIEDYEPGGQIHTYRAGGTIYGPGGPGGHGREGPGRTGRPPMHGFGHSAQIDCVGGVQANHNGSCPDGFMVKHGGNGVAYCCPMGAGTDPGPPQSRLFNYECLDGWNGHFTQAKLSQQNTSLPHQPFGGKTPLALEREWKDSCDQNEGQWLRRKDQLANGDVMISFGCCLSSEAVDEPPTTGTQTGPGTYPVGGQFPPTPDASALIFRAHPIADLAAGGYGWGQAGMRLIRFASGNCATYAAASGPPNLPLENVTPEEDCTKLTQALWLYNPGDATIPKGTGVIAARDAIETASKIVRATIIVVACPSS